MIVSRAWSGKRYAVLGLARSGLATVHALVAGGAEVTIWDSSADRREEAVDSVQEISRDLDSIALRVADPLEVDLTGFAGVVVSPGVPINRHPIAEHARAAGVPLIGDIELFSEARAELPPHKVVGITGTNGKSTTTALIDHICRAAGRPSLAGGNIGLPILGRDPLPEGGVYVLELSSYQIDLTHGLDCDVAVLLNITPDHLDRYDGFEGYAASKARLFAMQSAGHHAVVDVISASDHDVLGHGLIASFIEDVFDFKSIKAREQRNWPALQGPHNLHNARAAIEVCDILGIEIDAVRLGLETFPGLPHRMERVKTFDGVLYVNDSKATNPDSTAPALAAYPRIHWILGGKAKTDDLDACRPGFGHVVRAYTIGEAAELFERLLEGEVPVEQSGTLEQAVRSAAANAGPGETVLLSPACASFDQFRDYEARGQAFRDAVEALG